MKVKITDAHDRLIHFKKQADYISQGCQDCIKNRPLEFQSHPFYIYAHARTEDDGFSKRLIWVPKLTKPKSTTNSMLFKHYPLKDEIKVIWILPEKHLWKQYELGQLLENVTVLESINMFENHREKLDAKEPDDLDDERIDKIYQEIARNSKNNKIFKHTIRNQYGLA